MPIDLESKDSSHLDQASFVIKINALWGKSTRLQFLILCILFLFWQLIVILIIHDTSSVQSFMYFIVAKTQVFNISNFFHKASMDIVQLKYKDDYDNIAAIVSANALVGIICFAVFAAISTYITLTFFFSAYRTFGNQFPEYLIRHANPNSPYKGPAICYVAAIVLFFASDYMLSLMILTFTAMIHFVGDFQNSRSRILDGFHLEQCSYWVLSPKCL